MVAFCYQCLLPPMLQHCYNNIGTFRPKKKEYVIESCVTEVWLSICKMRGDPPTSQTPPNTHAALKSHPQVIGGALRVLRRSRRCSTSRGVRCRRWGLLCQYEFLRLHVRPRLHPVEIYAAGKILSVELHFVIASLHVAIDEF